MLGLPLLHQWLEIAAGSRVTDSKSSSWVPHAQLSLAPAPPSSVSDAAHPQRRSSNWNLILTTPEATKPSHHHRLQTTPNPPRRHRHNVHHPTTHQRLPQRRLAHHQHRRPHRGLLRQLRHLHAPPRTARDQRARRPSDQRPGEAASARRRCRGCVEGVPGYASLQWDGWCQGKATSWTSGE